MSCAFELLDQFEAQKLDVGWIVLASGSAGTHAGMLAGLHAAHSNIPVLGISVRQPEERQIKAVYGLAKGTAAQSARAGPTRVYYVFLGRGTAASIGGMGGCAAARSAGT